MKIAAISDTHGLEISLPESEVLIHAGDMTMFGTWTETAAAGRALGAGRHAAVLLVPGNHDTAFCHFLYPTAEDYFFMENTHLLVDAAWEYKGYVFYGTPWTPRLKDMETYCDAYMQSESFLRRRFMHMPDEIDVLITHGPPKGILDNGCGSEALREAIEKRKIRRHIFGHIHECGGMSFEQTQHNGTRRDSNNVAIMPIGHHGQAHTPLVFEL
jgi:Icc-related predicted phosphoesterase